MEIIKSELKVDFMGRMKPAITISLALVLITFISLIMQGGLKFGIDFEGGTLVQLRFKTAPNIEDIRAGLKNIGMGESTIQEFGSKTDILIRVQKSDEKLKAIGAQVKDSLKDYFNVADITVDRVEMVGPKVGKDLREKALLSIVYAIIAIVIYISWRFKFQYAVAAIIALIHDVILTMGAFSIAGKEFTLVIVAAFLTIIGYSLNDTIVIFDRIRENLRRKGKGKLVELINTSINQTLSRTMLTSGTTLLVVLALFFLGGEIIHDFAFALLIGVAVGTYSSVFIASVFLIYWENRFKAKRRA
jgi:preprotein translocase subunit SecF